MKKGKKFKDVAEITRFTNTRCVTFNEFCLSKTVPLHAITKNGEIKSNRTIHRVPSISRNLLILKKEGGKT